MRTDSLTVHSQAGSEEAIGIKASDIGVTDPIAEQAEFVAELVRRRMTARLSQGALGALMGYDRTYVNKVERGALEPTADFTRKAEETLQLGGELWRRWEAFEQSRRHLHRPRLQARYRLEWKFRAGPQK